MSLALEAPNTVWSTQTVVLDGVSYIFEYQWSNRYDTWYLSIFDINENPLLTGVRLVPWVPIFRNHPQRSLPAGELVLFDQQSEPPFSDKYPNENDFGTRFVLYYFTQEELES